jgi:ribosome-associated protein
MYPEESEHERALLERVNREVDEMEAKKAKKAAKQKRSAAGSRTASEMPPPLLSDVDVDPEAAVKRAAAEAGSLTSPEQSLQMELLRLVVKLLKEEGGRDIVAIDVSRKTNWVNSMIVVTGMVSRHNVALANKIRMEMKTAGLVKSTKIERNEDDEWIIVNCGSLIVEIMTEDQRAALDLERLWVLKQDEIEALAADTEAAEFTYDDEDGARHRYISIQRIY